MTAYVLGYDMVESERARAILSWNPRCLNPYEENPLFALPLEANTLLPSLVMDPCTFGVSNMLEGFEYSDEKVLFFFVPLPPFPWLAMNLFVSSIRQRWNKHRILLFLPFRLFLYASNAFLIFACLYRRLGNKKFGMDFISEPFRVPIPLPVKDVSLGHAHSVALTGLNWFLSCFLPLPSSVLFYGKSKTQISSSCVFLSI